MIKNISCNPSAPCGPNKEWRCWCLGWYADAS